MMRQLREDIAQLLQNGQHQPAFARVSTTCPQCHAHFVLPTLLLFNMLGTKQINTYI